MHILSKKDSSSDEMETLQRSRKSTTVVTANGEVQTNEEAQVYVHDLDLFGTVQILDDTPAVLSLGKLFEEQGKTNEWASGQKPHLTKPCKNFLMQNGKLRTSCCPWIVCPILVPVRPLHRHRRTHQVHLQVQQQSEVTMEQQATGGSHQ